MPAGRVSDATQSFSAGRPYQSVMAVQCSRFIDSECDFTPRCVSLLQVLFFAGCVLLLLVSPHKLSACVRTLAYDFNAALRVVAAEFAA